MNDIHLSDWRKIAPSDGHHYFFGYYDRVPWNADNTFHLALKVEQRERLPERGERAEVGVIETASGRYERLTTTRAWCHQQGAMTLWLNHRPGSFIYNDWDEGDEKLVARIFDLNTGRAGRYERPVYAMSPNGRWGATLNFGRIPRRGYSYADTPLDTSVVDADKDGIFVIDLHSGESRLAVTYRHMFDLHPAPYLMEGQHVWLNHIIFNWDSSKVLFLLRHQPKDSLHKGGWKTYMYTANIDGSNLVCPLPDFYWSGAISHQIWGRTPHEILIDANWSGKGSDYVVFDERTVPLRASRISRGLGPAGHLNFSPDGRRMLADTYSDNGVQRLGLVDVATGGVTEIGRFRHEQPADCPGDVRCDLHPRWSNDGSLISVDSIHNGTTGIWIRDA